MSTARASKRASAAPTQKWMPCPNAKWRLGDPRVKSTRSGLSNWAGSRFPAAKNSRRGSAILGQILDAFAEDVYGRYADAMNVMTDLIREGQQTGEIRGGDVGGLAHLASVLTNEYALADVALARPDFHAIFDGALRADPAC